MHDAIAIVKIAIFKNHLFL